MGDDKFVSEEKAIKKPVASSKAPAQEEEAAPAKPVQKFEGKGLAGVIKKLSEEKLEDKAKRITEKLEKNPDKKDKVVEKEKRPAKKTAEKADKKSASADKPEKAEKAAPKKTTKK